MKKLTVLLTTFAMVALMASGASAALTINIYDPGTGSPIDAGSFSWNLTGNTIDIYETWTGAGRGFLEFSGLDHSTTYTLNKHLTNKTGYDWILFSNELLDPAGQQNDTDYDPTPYPSWVPAGFTTSNHFDDLWYPADISRTSTSFSKLFVDDQTHKRDFLEFYNGTVSGSGGTDLMSFGLRNNWADNEPFLLAQRPNEHSVPDIPEPGTLILLGSGLTALGLFRRWK